MGHTKEWCWKKNGKGPIITMNFLEALVNDEEAMLVELNRLWIVKNNVFLKAIKR